MKKRMGAVLLFAMLLTLCACKTADTPSPVTPKPEKTEHRVLALCCDIGSVNDAGVNESCYAVVENVTKQNKLSLVYYTLDEENENGAEENIRQAMTDGATLIICLGDRYAPAIPSLAEKYPSESFLSLVTEEYDAAAENVTVLVTDAENAPSALGARLAEIFD